MLMQNISRLRRPECLQLYCLLRASNQPQIDLYQENKGNNALKYVYRMSKLSLELMVFWSDLQEFFSLPSKFIDTAQEGFATEKSSSIYCLITETRTNLFWLVDVVSAPCLEI